MTQRWGFLAAVLVIVLLLASPSPSGATSCDLFTAGSSCTINGAIYTQVPERPTGSGVIDSFVRIDTPGGSVTPSEQGYNTSVRPLPQSGGGQVNQYTNTSLTFTHDLSLGSVPISGGFRQFLLDINEANSNPIDARLTLDRVLIFVTPTALLDPVLTLTALSGTLTGNGGTFNPIYNLDNGGDNWVNLNYALNTGSGSGDMTLNVPISATSGFVYLYSQFGCDAAKGEDTCGTGVLTKYAASDGYEEWATTAQAIPEPATILLLGIGLVGTGLMWSRRRRP